MLLRHILKYLIIFYKYLVLRIVFLKCKINYYIYGAEGVGYVLEKIKQPYIIPVIKAYGGTIGEKCRVLPGVTFHNLSGKNPFRNLVLGKNVYIGRNVLLDLAENIHLDNDSALGAGCQLWTHVGDFSFDFSDYFERKASIYIGKGVICWSMVIISPGSKIGDYTRVAAGSVVTKDLDSKAFYGGSPAKIIKFRNI